MSESAMFVDYDVTIEFTSNLCGTMPESEKAQRAFLHSLKIPPDEADAAKDAMLGDVPAIPEAEETVTTFKRDDKGLYIESRQIKAMLKECAVLLGYTEKNNPGRQYFQHGVSVLPEKLHLGKSVTDGELVQHGVIMGPLGQRAIITKARYISPGCRVAFTIRCVVGKNMLKADVLQRILALGQENGMGARRASGCGRFRVVKATSKEVDCEVKITTERKAKKGAA